MATVSDSRKPRRIRRAYLVAGAALAAATLAAAVLPRAYQSHVNARLAQRLDAELGQTGWVVSWTVADAQWGEQLALYRTIYVRFLSPRLQAATPWRDLQFTHPTTTPNRPWHYAVQIVSEAAEVTYYWSIREHRWNEVWRSEVRYLPPEARHSHAERLRRVERRKGLNWPATGG